MSVGGVELDRTVTSIQVGARFRHDLGDLTDLCDSIRQFGLLQPITITPDGTLVCGARRLAAVKRLGWDHVKVWIVSNISTRLTEVLAEQHENTARKPLAPSEAAALYDELKTLLAQDAARRQQHTRFGSDGGDESSPPWNDHIGKAREQAAQAITGKKSFSALNHVLDVQHLAENPATPDQLRLIAQRELAAMDQDGKINPHYLTVQAARTAHEHLRASGPGRARPHGTGDLELFDPSQAPAELVAAAQAAIHRALNDDAPATASEVRRYGVQLMRQTIDDMDGWWRHYDPDEIAARLPEDYWQRMWTCCRDSTRFIEAVAQARQALKANS